MDVIHYRKKEVGSTKYYASYLQMLHAGTDEDLYMASLDRRYLYRRAYRGKRLVLAVTRKGKVVGICKLVSCKSIGQFYVWGLYVHPDYRNQGVATKLLKTMLRAWRGPFYIRVYKYNDHSVRAIKRAGFKLHKTDGGRVDQYRS